MRGHFHILPCPARSGFAEVGLGSPENRRLHGPRLMQLPRSPKPRAPDFTVWVLLKDQSPHLRECPYCD
jgi:hypothetical protein